MTQYKSMGRSLFVAALAALMFTSAPVHAEKKPAKKAASKKATTPKAAPAESTPDLTPSTESPTQLNAAPTTDSTTTSATGSTSTTTSSTTTTTTPVPTESHSDKYGKSEGVLGKFLLGPNITALGFPTPFRFGVDTKYDNMFGLAFSYGLFPSLTLSSISLKFNSWRVDAKVYPFSGAMYVGVGFGKQTLNANYSKVTASTPVNYALSVNSTIITPHIGWRWVWASGFFYGMEAGVQLSASSTATFTTDAPAAVQATAEYTSNKKDIEDKGKTFGQTTLPHFALVQLGWFL